ncbi:general odorant-binding protein 56a-like [Bacillus rossius redtenbacheri]|uniref:general odorant-binding protein 56a-like n=1 Tax=Bacillus rossius redtenbacheri TaxID=93214 RepID=UPI002FDCD0AE
MKTAAVLAVLAAALCVAQVDSSVEDMWEKIDPEKKMRKAMEECQKEPEKKVDLKECEKQYAANEVSEDCKCLAKCVMDKLELTKDGKIAHDEIQKHINEKVEDENTKNIANKLHEKCKDSDKGEGGCEGPYRYTLCIVANCKADKECYKEDKKE